MKKWENPELSFLGIEKTREGVCDCGATTYRAPNNQHYCHRDNLWHRNNCMSLQQGHFQSGSNCNGDHSFWGGKPHESNCCCATGESMSS